jgi:hypothetical protein
MEHGRQDVFVGIDGAGGRNVWEVALVLLTTKGMDSLSAAVQSVGEGAWMSCVLSSSACGGISVFGSGCCPY